MRDLRGVSVVITGTSSGIGRAAVIAFAGRGPDRPLMLIAVSWSFAVVGWSRRNFSTKWVIGLTGFTVALFFSVLGVAPLWTAI
jgi:hypothetical protein